MVCDTGGSATGILLGRCNNRKTQLQEKDTKCNML